MVGVRCVLIGILAPCAITILDLQQPVGGAGCRLQVFVVTRGAMQGAPAENHLSGVEDNGLGVDPLPTAYTAGGQLDFALPVASAHGALDPAIVAGMFTVAQESGDDVACGLRVRRQPAAAKGVPR